MELTSCLPTDAQLDDMEAFQLSLGRQANPESRQLSPGLSRRNSR